MDTTAGSNDGPSVATGVGLDPSAALEGGEATPLEEVERLVDDTREQVRQVLRRRKEGVADRLAGVAAALREAGERLDEEVAEGLGDLPERAASQVDRASRYVYQSEVRELARDAEALARRRPLLFLAGSFTAGFLLARFFRSTAGRGEA
jgi:hypothetical protein